MSSEKFQPQVLFCDYNQYWCPLGNLYWSQSSKVLISRHLRSSLEEIISTFCPQCLTRYSEDECTNYLGRCPSCYQCPCCEATLTPFTTEEAVVVLLCTTCLWRSDQSKVSAPTKIALDTLILQHEKEGVAKTAFDMIFSKHLKAENSLKSRALVNNSISIAPRQTSSSRSKGLWQLKDLEMQMEETARRYQTPEMYTFEAFVPEISRLREEQRIAVSTLRDISELATPAQQFRNLHSSPLPVLLRSELYPTRVQMRSKRTLRSLCDVDASGRMRLLVQSKVFPTEGDSSERMIRGKWWAIDCSAVHEIPFVSILKLPSVAVLSRPPPRSQDTTTTSTTTIITTDSGGEYAYLEISITNALEADIVWSFTEIETESPHEGDTESITSSEQTPFFLLNQFDKPIDTMHNVLLTAAPLLAVSSDDLSEGQVRRGQLDIDIGAYEDELLKDADDEQSVSTSKKGVSTPNSASSISSSAIVWTVRVDQNIAFVRIPVRVPDLSILSNSDGSTRRFEVKFNITMTQGSNAPVSLPIRIIF